MPDQHFKRRTTLATYETLVLVHECNLFFKLEEIRSAHHEQDERGAVTVE